ncbi:thiamine phosphate synthase [Glaesserella parasuis]|nr:thiamine phosphate synthase [Glaesserella parasuis]MDP0173846.1 thiamine phosphate synthase [Glaesserella parasuis]
MFQRELLSVYFVAGTQDCLHLPTGSPEQKLLSTLETALQAGITCYQFREKANRHCKINRHNGS